MSGALSRVLLSIGMNRQRLLTAKAIVFDVRGNTGGQAQWGARAATALFGSAYMAYRFHRNIELFWRAEASNAESLRENPPTHGPLQLPGAMRALMGLADQLDEAAARGEALVSSAEWRNPELLRPPAENPVQAEVFLLTDGTCVSACLIFADILLSFEGVRHIGYPTGADTEYTSVRMRDLPSGHARLIHPIMIRRDPDRKSGAFYMPELIFNAFDWTDESVQAWFLTEVLAPKAD